MVIEYHISTYRFTKDITMELINGYLSTVMVMTILLALALNHCNGESMSLGKGMYKFINLEVLRICTLASLFKFAILSYCSVLP